MSRRALACLRAWQLCMFSLWIMLEYLHAVQCVGSGGRGGVRLGDGCCCQQVYRSALLKGDMRQKDRYVTGLAGCSRWHDSSTICRVDGGSARQLGGSAGAAVLRLCLVPAARHKAITHNLASFLSCAQRHGPAPFFTASSLLPYAALSLCV